MKKLFFLGVLMFFILSVNSQVCVTMEGWSLVSDNENGTCTYDLTITVDSGNGAAGTVTFSLAGAIVHTVQECTCNPTTITFPITVTCESTINVDVNYDAPGNGGDCTGSTGDIILPVEWHDIAVENVAHINRIYWSTYTETNNDQFIIEHRTNAHDFIEIGYVKGAGHSIDLKYYDFTHYPLENGMHYYRVKQVDFNGKFSYSPVVSIETFSDEIIVHPNPFKDFVFLRNTPESIQWVIFDVYGEAVLKGSGPQLDVYNLPSGFYALRLINDSEVLHSETLIKL